MSKSKKIIVVLTILVATLAITLIPTFTSATINPADYKPNEINNNDLSAVTKIVNPIIALLRYGGIAISIIILIILGIKYMIGSVSEKAEYKKSMMLYVIGVMLLVSTTQLLAIIIEIVENL